MSQKIQSKILSKMVLYLFVGIGLYLFALVLGVILKLVFNITFVSVGGEDVDVVTYIGLGAIDFILTLIRLFFSAVVIITVWLWNTFIVDLFFRMILGFFLPFLQSFPRIPEEQLVRLIELIDSVVNLFKTVGFNILGSASDIISGGAN